MNEPDFSTANYGNMTALSPRSNKAYQAIVEGLIAFEDWHEHAGSILIDRRMADDVIANLRRDGFTVAVEGGEQL